MLSLESNHAILYETHTQHTNIHHSNGVTATCQQLADIVSPSMPSVPAAEQALLT